MQATDTEKTILYLVHNLSDPAVERRVKMFRAGKAQVSVAGFNRKTGTRISSDTYFLGDSHDGRLLRRVLVVVKALLKTPKLALRLKVPDLIVARNLEMLLIGLALKKQLGNVPLVYECLDIHRVMMLPGLCGQALRLLERRLMQRCRALVVSSPAFIREYFIPVQCFHGEAILVENRMLVLERGPAPPKGHEISSKIRIGWFGMLRCRKSLEILLQLANASAEKIEIVIAGQPSVAVFENFEEQITHRENVHFLGAYMASDLERLYGMVDFAWCIDFFEEGLNSKLLLPNKLYESIAFGVIPIALRSVETGRWLAAHSVGLLIDNVEQCFISLPEIKPEQIEKMRAECRSLPRDLVMAGPQQCVSLVDKLFSGIS